MVPSMANDPNLLTVADVALELGLGTSAVYKLIERKKLATVRLSERGTRVPRPALEAYKAALATPPVHPPRPECQALTEDELRAVFAEHTGLTPEHWMEAWKAGLVEDSGKSMRIMMSAARLRAWSEISAVERHVAGEAVQSLSS
jgi:excisionase family DNA binding protein